MTSHFHTNLKILRESRGLSQEALADELGDTSRQTIGAWESGRFNPPICKLIKVAEFFDVTVDSLLKSEVVEHTHVGRYITKFDHDNNEIFLGN